MDMLGIVLMWFFNVLTSRFRNDYGAGDFSVDSIIEAVNSISNVYNIFAWINMFVPVSFLITLAMLTTVFYSYQFILSMVKYIISLFKR